MLFSPSLSQQRSCSFPYSRRFILASKGNTCTIRRPCDGVHCSLLDWQQHRLMIYSKLSKRRVVRLTQRIQPLLERHLSRHDSPGIGVRTIQRLVKDVANIAHIRQPVTHHVLRHTFAVTCIQKGISTRALQEAMGHDRLATTEIYLNLSPEEVMSEFEWKW